MLTAARQEAPEPLKWVVRAAWRGLRRKGGRAGLVGRGTVQDLYYWIADGQTDTIVLLNNFFSDFFPTIKTATTGTLTLLDANGSQIGTTSVSVPHLGFRKLRVSHLLSEWLGENTGKITFGNMYFTLDIPEAVTQRLVDIPGPFYFWHRFYIEYVRSGAQPAWVHCVDKTYVHRLGSTRLKRWYPSPIVRDWAPEIPFILENYRQVQVILANRTHKPAKPILSVRDTKDNEKSFPAVIAPNGVHRFVLDRKTLEGLAPDALRLKMRGIPTSWSRPLLFKEFRNGSISTMHC